MNEKEFENKEVEMDESYLADSISQAENVDKSYENSDLVEKPYKSCKIMKCVRLKRTKSDAPQGTEGGPDSKELREQKKIQNLEKKQLKEQEAEMKRLYDIKKEELRIQLMKAKLDEKAQKQTDLLNKSRERIEKLRLIAEEKNSKKLEKEQAMAEKQKIIDAKNRKKEQEQSYFKRFFTPVTKSPRSQQKSSHWLFHIPDESMEIPLRCLTGQALDNFEEFLRGGWSGAVYKPPRVRFVLKPSKLGAKLLQFHDNNRPPYYGTWTKKSSVVSGKSPFGKDELFDYDFDSDAEWHEEEPGENLMGSDNEADEEDLEDPDNDGFLVPDGHLSEDEGGLEDEMYAEKTLKGGNVLNKIVVGCIWDGERSDLDMYQVIEIPPLTEQIEAKSNLSKRPVPEEAMTFLIKLCHANPRGIQSLITEFQLFWIKHTGIILDTLKIRLLAINPSDINVWSPISRRQLERKMTEISSYERRADKKMWYVHDHVLKHYGLEDLPSTNEWEYITHKPVE